MSEHDPGNGHEHADDLRDGGEQDADIPGADQRALTALFAALVADAEPSTLSAERIRRLATEGDEPDRNGQEAESSPVLSLAARREKRLRFVRNGLIAAAVAALGIFGLSRLDLQTSNGVAAGSSASSSASSSAPAAAGSAIRDAPGADAATGELPENGKAAGGAASGTSAASSGAASPAAPAAPAAASSASAGFGAASSGAVAGSAQSSAAASRPASGLPQSAAASSEAMSSSPSASSSSSASAPSAPTCVPLPPAALKAAVAALPAPYRASKATGDGCRGIVIAGPAGAPAVRIRISRSTGGNCVGSPSSSCVSTSGSAGTYSYDRSAVFIGRNGSVAVVSTAAGGPGREALAAAGRAVLNALG